MGSYPDESFRKKVFKIASAIPDLLGQLVLIPLKILGNVLKLLLNFMP